MKEKYRRRMRLGFWVILSLLILSLINALMVGTGFQRLGSVVNLWNWARYVWKYGIPGKLWFVFFLIYLVLAFVFLYLKYMDSSEQDKLHRNFRMAKGRQTYGEAHFEEPREYRKVAIIQKPEDAYGSIYGQLDQTGKYLVVQNLREKRIPNLNKAVFGSAGVGKSYSYVKPECLQIIKRRESVIITDPDGGLYRDMASAFEKNGYVVRCLNLKDLRHSDGWNCMNALSKDSLTTDSAIFSRIIINNCNVDVEGIYRDGPEALLNALVLRVFLGREFQGDRVNIRNAYNMLITGSGEEYLDMMFDINQLTQEEQPCLKPYAIYKKASPNLRGNLIVNLASSLNVLQDDNLSRVLSTDDIDLERPGQEPCAYFCVFPDSHDTYKFIVSLFFSMLFIKLIALADVQPDGRLPIPVNFLMDEFANIGVLPDWDQKMATIRKRAISVTMILQNITQLQNSYDDAWWTILSNCATWMFLGVNDEETAKILSNRIGLTTAEVQTEQHRSNEGLLSMSWGRNTGEGKRALLAPDELNKMDTEYNIVIFQGHNPVLTMKYPLHLHPMADILEPRPLTLLPSINDPEGREKRFEAEAERIKAYNEKHPLNEVDRTFATCCVQTHLPTFWDHLLEEIRTYISIIREDWELDRREVTIEEVRFSDDMEKALEEVEVYSEEAEGEAEEPAPEEKPDESPTTPQATEESEDTLDAEAAAKDEPVQSVKPESQKSEKEPTTNPAKSQQSRVIPEPAKPAPERAGGSDLFQMPKMPEAKPEITTPAAEKADKRRIREINQKYGYQKNRFNVVGREDIAQDNQIPGKRKR